MTTQKPWKNFLKGVTNSSQANTDVKIVFSGWKVNRIGLYSHSLHTYYCLGGPYLRPLFLFLSNHSLALALSQFFSLENRKLIVCIPTWHLPLLYSPFRQPIMAFMPFAASISMVRKDSLSNFSGSSWPLLCNSQSLPMA